MRVGDKILFRNHNYVDNNAYTFGKYYDIVKVEMFGLHVCGWIIDDYGSQVYFREEEANDHNWILLKDLRKQKLDKIYKNYV